jgi:Ankyrin repeats (many copies)
VAMVIWRLKRPVQTSKLLQMAAGLLFTRCHGQASLDDRQIFGGSGWGQCGGCNAQRMDTFTPLHVACWRGHLAVVCYLVHQTARARIDATTNILEVLLCTLHAYMVEAVVSHPASWYHAHHGSRSLNLDAHMQHFKSLY